METKIEKISGCKYKVSYKATAKEFENAIDKAFEEKRKKGFDKEDYIEKNGVESLYEKALNVMILETFTNTVEKEKISPLDYPTIVVDYSTLGIGKSLEYYLEFEVYPEIELGKYLGLKVKQDSIEVFDYEVENEISRNLSKYAKLEDSNHNVLELGDYAVFDFLGSIDGVPFEGGKAENYELEIGSGQFIPGFEDQMVGMQINEKRNLNVKFPDNYHSNDLAGKDSVFEVKLHQIKTKKFPKLDDDFVVNTLKIDGVKTVDDYKVYLRNTLKQMKIQNSQSKFIDDCINLAIKNTKMEIPNCMVNWDIDRQVQELEENAKRYEVPVDVLLKYSGFSGIEEYKESIKNSCIENVKIRLVLTKIAEVENIKVTEEEYNEEIENIANSSNISKEEAMKIYSKDSINNYILVLKARQLIVNSAIVE